MVDKLMSDKAIICVIGLGYVGLPLATAFSKSLKVVGFDTDREKLKKLNESKSNQNLIFTDRTEEISRADFVIVCVPTPVTKSKEPDLSHVEDAARITGQNMKRGSVVILESSVYPGVTEEIVKPILESKSGLKCGKDFKIAYSPERVNPGDKKHSIDNITKVVAGMDGETTELVAELYRKVTPNIFKATNIKTAEAAKIIENVQRDLNIALMNELSLIFEKMGLNTKDVLDAAATKWNFHHYSPGLVGGHCIPVDPYYLVCRAKELGYHPQVILAGRNINDSMPRYVAQMAVQSINSVGKVTKGAQVLIMGLTYKENVPDIRESPAKELVKTLKELGTDVYGYDPLLSNIEEKFDIKAIRNLEGAPEIDCVIMTVAHTVFKKITLDRLKKHMGINPVLIDIRRVFNKEEAKRKGFHYETL